MNKYAKSGPYLIYSFCRTTLASYAVFSTLLHNHAVSVIFAPPYFVPLILAQPVSLF